MANYMAHKWPKPKIYNVYSDNQVYKQIINHSNNMVRYMIDIIVKIYRIGMVIGKLCRYMCWVLWGVGLSRMWLGIFGGIVCRCMRLCCLMGRRISRNRNIHLRIGSSMQTGCYNIIDKI